MTVHWNKTKKLSFVEPTTWEGFTTITEKTMEWEKSCLEPVKKVQVMRLTANIITTTTNITE